LFREVITYGYILKDQHENDCSADSFTKKPYFTASTALQNKNLHQLHTKWQIINNRVLICIVSSNNKFNMLKLQLQPVGL